MEYLLALVTLALGLAVGYLIARGGVQRLQAEAARLAAEREAARQQLEELRGARKQEEDAFGNLARRVLAESTETFLQQAAEKLGAVKNETAAELEQRKQAIEALVAPLRENLGKLEQRAQEMEQARQHAYGALLAEVRGLGQATQSLQSAHQSLATALRGSSQARGRWGEITLRRIAELAGMTAHIDFAEQQSAGEGRPDMVVRLPGGGAIPVDSKVPLAGYLDAVASVDPAERERHLKRHAADLRQHVLALARREYAEAVDGHYDFTVLFLPGEPFLAAAFEQNPELQVEALDKRVLIATPVTLVALLRTVGIYWQQHNVAADAQKAWEAAREFHKRVAAFSGHLGNMGKGLDRALRSYNEAVGSFERSVLPQGRRLEQLGAVRGNREIEALEALDQAPRAIAPEAEESEGPTPSGS